VKFFLSKKLNASIKSDFYGEEDSCLNVASRWGYEDIVRILLDKGGIAEKEVSEAIKLPGIKKKIFNLLNDSLPKGKKIKGCACF
jgi:hypothetical protein